MTEPTPRPRRPLPLPDPDSAPYWEGARSGELRLQRCGPAGHVQFYPRAVCATCAGEVEWFPAAGRGTVYSFTVVRRSRAQPFDVLVPYVLALVDLDEGVRMMTNVVGCEPEDVHIGMPVEVTFEPETEDISLPMWRPSGRDR